MTFSYRRQSTTFRYRAVTLIECLLKETRNDQPSNNEKLQERSFRFEIRRYLAAVFSLPAYDDVGELIVITAKHGRNGYDTDTSSERKAPVISKRVRCMHHTTEMSRFYPVKLQNIATVRLWGFGAPHTLEPLLEVRVRVKVRVGVKPGFHSNAIAALRLNGNRALVLPVKIQWNIDTGDE